MSADFVASAVAMVIIALCAWLGVAEMLGAVSFLFVVVFVVRFLWHSAEHRVVCISDLEYRHLLRLGKKIQVDPGGKVIILESDP